MILTIFDIDGTLIKINGAGRHVMTLALDKVYGHSGMIDQVSFAGKTDLALVNEAMRTSALDDDEIVNGYEAVFREMANLGEEIFPNSGLEPCPGVIDLLRIIARHGNIQPGLLTGNAKHTTSLKLTAAGIDPMNFKFGAYGSETSERNALVPIAIERARLEFGREIDKESAIIIGDTPADIACAKANNLPSLAVATGTFSMNSLSTFNPNFLLRDLSDTDEVLDIFQAIRDDPNG